jgi:hypothetical protein
MKTAELSANTTYALQESSYGSVYPVLVVEAKMWTEKNEWFDKAEGEGREERRILRHAQKDERPGSRNGWRGSYRKTGIPVLKLHLSDWHFEEYSYVETADELLAEAAEKLVPQIMVLLDSKQHVFAQNADGMTARKTRTTVTAHLTEGGSKEIPVELELVRPQQIQSLWADHLENRRKAAVVKADMAKERADKKAASDEVARNIASRLDSLLGASKSYTHEGERYDAYREDSLHGGTTYRVDQDTLLKLLALAEKAGQ